MRISLLMEGVLAAAVGFWLAQKLGDLDHWYGFRVSEFRRFRWYGNATAGGVGLVVGLGTWLEWSRRQSPRPWGRGRWVWSIAAAYLLIDIVTRSAVIAAGKLSQGQWSYFHAELGRSLHSGLAEGFALRFGLILTVFAIILRITRPALGLEADAREWAGRGFAVLVILLASVELIVAVTG